MGTMIEQSKGIIPRVDDGIAKSRSAQQGRHGAPHSKVHSAAAAKHHAATSGQKQ